MKKKYTTENVIKIFNELGYEYVNGESNCQYDKITVKDKDGYLHYQNVANATRRNPMPFTIFNPYTILNIKTYLKNNDSNTELLSKEYESNSKHLNWKCERCGEIFERTWNKMQQSKTMCCDKCSHEIVGINRRYSQEDVNNILKDKGWKMCDGGTYVKNDEYFNVINNEGYKARTNILLILTCDNNIDIINKRNPFTIYNINLYLKKNKLPFEVIDDNYEGSSYKLLCKCLECGHEFRRDWSTFKDRKSVLCPSCSLKSKSYISWLVKIWLEENNINYVTEKRFEDCKDKLPLPFDYYIEDKNLLIEVDGSQHYEIRNFASTIEENINNYEYIIKHDKMKNDYAKDNNIQLLRLPYWDFKNDTYKNKLKEILL